MKWPWKRRWLDGADRGPNSIETTRGSKYPDAITGNPIQPGSDLV